MWIGLEDLMVAGRGEHVDLRLGIGEAELGEQRCAEHRVAEVVELDDQDPARRGDLPQIGRNRRKAATAIVPSESERVDEQPPAELAVAVSPDLHGPGLGASTWS